MEKPSERKDDFELARESLVEAIEEAVTDKNWSKNWGDPDEIMSKLRSGQKIRWQNRLWAVVVMAGQSFRLSPEDIDLLKEEIFEVVDED